MKMDMKGAWVTYANIGFGTRIYVCYVRNMACPVGFVWGIGARAHRKQHFEVHGSFVIPPARRNGVRSLINEEIFKEFEVISTLSATPEAKHFLKATGFKYDPKRDDWHKVKP